MPKDKDNIKRLIALTQHLIDSTVTEVRLAEYEELLRKLKAELQNEAQ